MFKLLPIASINLSRTAFSIQEVAVTSPDSLNGHPLGVLELKNNRDGFLRRKEHAYLAESGDVFVAQRLIERLGLRTGDVISGALAQQRGRGRGPALASVTLVNGLPPESVTSHSPSQKSN